MIHSTLASRRLALRPVALAVALIAAGGCALAQAQAAASAEASLPAVTVSASGLQLGAGDMTTPVTVLEGDELVRRREATLGETLSSEPGITSSHFGAGASRPIIRGMDGPRVRVLSDGAELHDASTISPDHAVVTEPLLAERVEVLRGPAALVHGGAVGGVVNVVEASCSSMPLASTPTRGPSMPRITGREAPAPKWVAWMPGSPARLSPRVAPRRSCHTSPSSTLTGAAMSSAASGRPVTVTSARVGAGAASCAWALSAAHSPAARAIGVSTGRKKGRVSPRETRAAPAAATGAAMF